MKRICMKEDERQLMIRALAVQGLRNPGFDCACRQAAQTLLGVKMYDDFRKLLADQHPPVET